MSATWSPGHRRIPSGLKVQGFHKRVKASLSLGTLQLIQYVAPADEIAEIMSRTNAGWLIEEGDATLLSIRFSASTGVIVNLSNLTEHELDEFKDFVIASIERARPSVQERDAIAQEAESNGEYTYARSNRPSPRLVGNPRPV